MPKKIVTALVAAAVIPFALVLSQATQAVAVGSRSPSAAEAFLPSRYGLPFINPSPAPTDAALRRATVGRCGGMAFAALDYYHRGEQPSAESASDPYITMRNLSSVLDNASRFIAWSVAPGDDAWWRGGSVGSLSRDVELPRLSGALAGGPSPLGLTRASGLDELSRNHQVVAYALDRTEDLARIHVYDPNLPGADDVVLQVDLADSSAPILQIRGELVVAEWSGMFVERYAPPLIQPASTPEV